MGNWGSSTWDSGGHWNPAQPTPPPTAFNTRKKSTMKRQPYFPRVYSERPDWFGNFAAQLPIANATLGMPALEVTKIVADALECKYATGLWLTAAREFGPAATAAVEDLLTLDGDPAKVFELPTFAPERPTGVVAVPSGAQNRIFLFVARIKAMPTFTENIGLQLGIIGPEDSTAHDFPKFTLKVLTGTGCDCMQVDFSKYGHKGVAVYCSVNGGPEELLGIDLATPYLDGRPLKVPGVAEKRTVRLRFYDDEGPNGDFTPAQTVNISPT